MFAWMVSKTLVSRQFDPHMTLMNDILMDLFSFLQWYVNYLYSKAVLQIILSFANAIQLFWTSTVLISRWSYYKDGI